MRAIVVSMLIGLASLAGGTGVLLYFVNTKPAPALKEPGDSSVPVVTARVVSRDVTLSVSAYGSARPKAEVGIIPEVSGRIVMMSPKLYSGEWVEKDELLFAIDPRTYQVAVDRLKAGRELARAQIEVLRQERKNRHAELEIVHAEVKIAQNNLKRVQGLFEDAQSSVRELDLTRAALLARQSERQRTESALALIGPRIREQEARLAIAQSDLDAAELDLSKAEVRAPFRGQVLSRQIEKDQFAQAGQVAARLFDPSVWEIPAKIKIADFSRLSPSEGGNDTRPGPGSLVGSKARVRLVGQLEEYAWAGAVTRAEAGIDPNTRTVTVVVEVERPWPGWDAARHLPLTRGAFCEVEITGRTMAGALVIPRAAMQRREEVYVVVEGERLEVVTGVSVLSVQGEEVVVSGPLAAGMEVIVTPMPEAVEGMRVNPSRSPGGSPASPPAVTTAPAGETAPAGGELQP